jgi:hypothetical protein
MERMRIRTWRWRWKRRRVFNSTKIYGTIFPPTS